MSETTTLKPSLRDKLIGAWELIDYTAYPLADPSKKVYPMGKDARGIIMYTHTGYMSAQLMVPGVPHFKVNDFSGGTEEEYATAGKNYVSYTGPFYLDESGEEPVLQHHMSVSSWPNWLGDTQRRMVTYEKEGDTEYIILGPVGEVSIGMEQRTTRLVWRKLPENHATGPPKDA